MFIAESGSVLRKKNDIKFMKTIEMPGYQFIAGEDSELSKVSLKDTKLYLTNRVDSNIPINNDTLTNLQEKIWFVVKPNPINNNNNAANTTNTQFQSNFQYMLKTNDIIKLGRIKFVIRDMNIIGKTVEKTSEIFKHYIESQNIENTEANICRICLQSSAEDQNPMISICKCKGSMNLIHLKCLKSWIGHKLTVKEITKKMGISYIVKSYNCEICKEPYPIQIKHGNTQYNLLTYSIPENQNYVILESLNSIKENQYPLSIHVLMFTEDDSFLLGRGHDSDVRISDISVSRIHSKIYLKDNQFMLEDCGSKFGSLVLAKDPVEVEESTKILQIGRTLLAVNYSKYEKKNPSKSENLSKVISEGKSEKNKSNKNIPTFDLETKSEKK
jgi:hypothetical protein